MWDDKRFDVGEFVTIDGHLGIFRIADTSKTGIYLLENCNTTKLVIAHKDQIQRVCDYNNDAIEQIASVGNSRADDSHDYFHGLSDEEIELMAQRIEEGVAQEQDEYRLMYNAVGSTESILVALIQCATSNSIMSPAELLAIRDRADALQNADIVQAIDLYFESKEA